MDTISNISSISYKIVLSPYDIRTDAYDIISSMIRVDVDNLWYEMRKDSRTILFNEVHVISTITYKRWKRQWNGSVIKSALPFDFSRRVLDVRKIRFSCFTTPLLSAFGSRYRVRVFADFRIPCFWRRPSSRIRFFIHCVIRDNG